MNPRIFRGVSLFLAIFLLADPATVFATCRDQSSDVSARDSRVQSSFREQALTLPILRVHLNPFSKSTYRQLRLSAVAASVKYKVKRTVDPMKDPASADFNSLWIHFVLSTGLLSYFSRDAIHHFARQSAMTWMVSVALIGVARFLWKRLVAYQEARWNKENVYPNVIESVFKDSKIGRNHFLATMGVVALDCVFVFLRWSAHLHHVSYFSFLDWAPDVTYPLAVTQIVLTVVFGLLKDVRASDWSEKETTPIENVRLFRTWHERVLVAFISAKIALPYLNPESRLVGRTFDIQDVAAYCISILISMAYHSWIWTRLEDAEVKEAIGKRPLRYSRFQLGHPETGRSVAALGFVAQ